MAYISLIIAFCLNACANILLKIGAERGLAIKGSFSVFVTGNWQFIVGVVLFAANVIFYFFALRSLPLSFAYPIMVAMSFLIINGYALTTLHEPITTLQIVGYVLILVGLSFVVLQAR